MAIVDNAKLIQFYTGTALPQSPVDNHVYFIYNENKGKLYKGNVLIGETNDTAAIEAMQKSIKDLQDNKASKDDLAAHVALYQKLVETVNGINARLTTAEGKITTAEGKITTLEGKVSTNEGNIATNTSDISTLKGQMKTAQDDIDAIEADYLKKEDKNELQGNINTLAGKIGTVDEGKTVMGIIDEIQRNAYDDTALREELSTELGKKADKTQVATDIAAAVKVEEEARIAAVSGVQGAVDALAGTHATDKAALEAAIALKADQTALDEVNQTLTSVKEEVDFFFNGALGDDPENATKVKNTLKEIQDYIDSDVEGASGMAASIQENAKDIEALEGRMDTAESNIAKKAEQSALESAVSTINAKDAAQDAKITALENKFGEGEGSVSDLISEAIAAERAEIDNAIDGVNTKAGEAKDAAAEADRKAVEAKGAADQAQQEVDALELVVAGKAAQSDLDALEERVETAEGEIDTLQSEMDAVEGRALALENELNTAETGLKARVTAVEGVAAANTANIALNATDITALYNALQWHQVV